MHRTTMQNKEDKDFFYKILQIELENEKMS